ncbi:hypothetical protein PENTCL1PPCAC_6281 [Pristionchus entomophagus]|uniref:carnosine N-methyltransferase n=1 Tax=Pristionchus entomophagus TaxID=358040 RepID=A0AAV5SLI8_9BILA|nr:hypothetical protein PENTCL1PPCAC_6281 [Pristionchus entomophagus]
MSDAAAAAQDTPPINGTSDIQENDIHASPQTAQCCSNHSEEDELAHISAVVDSFFYYNHFQRRKLSDKLAQFQTLSTAHKKLLEPHHSEHTRQLMKCMEQNQSVLEMLICEGVSAVGPLGEKALSKHEGRAASPDLMSKINSTLKQIAREWSTEGKSERDATFGPLLRELESRFPEESREKHHIIVPGSGLSRLAWEISCLGFTTVACEFSSYMLIVSFVLLNIISEENEFTIHPFISGSCNTWSYPDRVRAVSFPDVCPTTASKSTELMSMRPGDFTSMFNGEDGKYSAVVTAWFIDTAHNVIEYIEHINRLLKVGGVWINSGPLTYHFSDTPEEISIELPFEEILRITSLRGFRIEKESRAEPSLYAADKRSMLRYTYECGFFVAIKESNFD